MPLPPPARLIALATLLGLAATCPAIDLESLTKNSPFGGSSKPATPDAAPSTLEFRGMYVDAGIAYYSIYNSLTKQSSWVAEGEEPSVNVPVVIKGFDLTTETLTIDNAGQAQKMELHQAVVATFRASSVPAAPVVQQSFSAPGVATTGQGGFNPQNLTPEQVEAFRQQMRDRYGKGGDNRGGDNRGGPTEGSSRGSRGSDNQTAPTSKTTPTAPTAKPPKTPKVR